MIGGGHEQRLAAAVRLVAGALLLGVALGVTACGNKATQVIVTVDAEDGVRMDSARLHVVILGGIGRTTAPTASRFDRVLTTDAGDPTYPFKFVLAPLDGDVGRSYSVTATAETEMSAFVGQARIIGGYVEGETLTVHLVLEDMCRRVMCSAEQTCKAGACVAARVGDEVDAGVVDAGQPEDGGLDAGDAAAPRDAATDAADGGVDAGDAGVPELDAGMDGGTPPVDAGPPDLGAPDMGGRCAARPSGNNIWAQYPLPGTPGHPRVYQVVSAGPDETVIDCVTGLEWERAIPVGTLYTRPLAMSHCDGLTLGGYADWRVPSRIELMTLLDYSVDGPGPMIDASAFPGTPAGPFWSASAFAPFATTHGWLLQFDVGAIDWHAFSETHYVRCVR